MSETRTSTDPLTVDALRTLLGLQDPTDHMLEARWRLATLKLKDDTTSDLEVLKRRGGRTTEMILKAVVHVANTGDNVTFVAENKDLASIILKTAQEYAAKAGVDRTKFEAVSGPSKTLRGLSSKRIFTDHLLVEGV